MCQNQDCLNSFEDLIDWSSQSSSPMEDNPLCPVCQATTDRLFYQVGTAHKAMINPSLQSKIMAKTQEMRNKLTGKTPWRKYSESQSD